MTGARAVTDAEARLARRRRFRRRRIVVFGALAVVLGLLGWGVVYGAGVLGAPVPASAATLADPVVEPAPTQQLAVPGFGSYALGAVGFDTPLLESPDQSVVPIASITKIVTALVVLEAKPLGAGEEGPEIEYTDVDVDIYWDVVAQDGSTAPVVAGSTLTERQSLTAMLLPSANNYAVSLASWAYGSMDAYLAAARGWLDAHGLAQTSVADASGLSAASVSTPRELVRLGELALAEPAIAEIVRMPSAELPVIGTVENTNELLGTDGVDGIKTGTTDEAGACLLFSTDVAVGSESVTVVGVLLGGEDHPAVDAAVSSLLSSVVGGFHEVAAIAPGEVLAEYGTPWGDTARARAASGATVLVWSDTPVEVAVSAAPVSLAPRGAEVGTAVVRAGPRTVEVPLVLDSTIDDPGVWWRISNPGALDPAAGSVGG